MSALRPADLAEWRSLPKLSALLLERREIAPRAKLTNASVLEARRAYVSGEACRAIARRMGVSQTCMRLVVHRKTWRHVSDEATA